MLTCEQMVAGVPCESEKREQDGCLCEEKSKTETPHSHARLIDGASSASYWGSVVSGVVDVWIHSTNYVCPALGRHGTPPPGQQFRTATTDHDGDRAEDPGLPHPCRSPVSFRTATTDHDEDGAEDPGDVAGGAASQ